IRLRRLNIKIHYLTKNEYINSRFNHFPHFIVGNSIRTSDILKNKYLQKLKNKTNIVYIGRFDLKTKGLDLLINHIAKHKYTYDSLPIVFNLYGPRSNDKVVLEQMVKDARLNNVFIHDEVFG